MTIKSIIVSLITTFVLATPLLCSNLKESSYKKNNKIFIEFFNENGIFIGNSSYQIPGNNDNSLKLITIEVEQNEQSKGFGTEIFKLTMQHIHNKYQFIESVYWDIWPFNLSENISYEKSLKKLYKFYQKVKATVNEENNMGYINLKDAGYFDEQ